MRNKRQEQTLIKIGEIIRKHRVAQKMSRVSLAVEIGTDEKHIRRIEDGKNNITIITLLKIFFVLKINIEVLAKIKIDKTFIED